MQGGCTANVASPVHKARIVISIRMKLQRIPYSCRSSCGSDGWVRWSVGPSSSAQEHSPPGRYLEETGISWIFSHGRLLFGKLNKKGAAFPGGKSHLQVLQWAIVSCAKNVKPTPNAKAATPGKRALRSPVRRMASLANGHKPNSPTRTFQSAPPIQGFDVVLHPGFQEIQGRHAD